MLQALRTLATLALAVLCVAPLAHGERSIPITIVTNGWHAGLVVPAQAINQRLPALQQRFPQAAFYELGWGDVGFYRAAQVNVDLALEALFASKGSVMHVVAVPDVAQLVRGRDAVQICVSPSQYQRMAQHIASSFAHDAALQPLSAGRGIYGDSEFYLARGRYHLLNTCNRWTAHALQAAGLDISPRLSLAANRVLFTARWQGAACAPHQAM